jgi:hypothetical protein
VLALVIALAWQPIRDQVIAYRYVAYDVLLGQRVSEGAGPDYAPNMFGSYDHVATRDGELAYLRSLVLDYPEEPHYRFLLAGSLMRCLALRDARAAYDQVARDGGPVVHSLLASIAWLEGDERTAQRLLDVEHEFREQMGLRLPRPVAATVLGNLPREVSAVARGADGCALPGERWGDRGGAGRPDNGARGR